MKKVLWVSRHEMTAEQRADLDRVMGGAELLPWKETVTDVAQLLPLLEQADAVAAVLPPELAAAIFFRRRSSRAGDGASSINF